MIKTFADKHTEQVYRTGGSKKLPADILARAVRRLEFIDLAATLDDLKVPPSNRLHPLKGDRAGQHSISINDQWRICFRWQGKDATKAFDVEIADYHY
jgi:proteic killer suppression protein